MVGKHRDPKAVVNGCRWEQFKFCDIILNCCFVFPKLCGMHDHRTRLKYDILNQVSEFKSSGSNVKKYHSILFWEKQVPDRNEQQKSKRIVNWHEIFGSNSRLNYKLAAMTTSQENYTLNKLLEKFIESTQTSKLNSSKEISEFMCFLITFRPTNMYRLKGMSVSLIEI